MLGTIITTIATLFANSGNNKAYNCDESSKFEPTLIRFIPDPIIAGGIMDINVGYINNYDTIAAGIQKMKVLFNGQHIPIEDESLCGYNTELCPISKGINAFNHTLIVPNVPGHVDMRIGWYAADGETALLCVGAKFDIEPAAAAEKKLRAQEVW
jgi:hypothetical protein